MSAINSAHARKARTYVLLFFMLFLAPLGNTVLDKGMKQIGSLSLSSPAAVAAGFLRIVTSPTIWAGMLCLMGYMICYMLVLSMADYSFVMPFTGTTFVLVPLFSFLWFREEVSLARWIGIAFVLAGVSLIVQTPHRTTALPENPAAPSR